jgi:hypothetical protein
MMKGLSKEQWLAAVLAAMLSVGGLGYLMNMQSDLSEAAKEGKAKRMADIEATRPTEAAKPKR